MRVVMFNLGQEEKRLTNSNTSPCSRWSKLANNHPRPSSNLSTNISQTNRKTG